MTHDTDATRLADAVARLAQLNQRARDQARAGRRSRDRRLVLSIAMVAMASFSMFSIASLSETLDVQALAQMSRVEVRARLPEARIYLEDTLEEQAPELISGGVHAVLDAMPDVRHMIVADLTHALHQVTLEFEEKAATVARAAIVKSRPEIERLDPDAPDKLELVAQRAADHFSSSFDTALSDSYPRYANVMAECTEHLRQLAATPKSRLSAADLNRREMIETVLLLAERSQ